MQLNASPSFNQVLETSINVRHPRAMLQTTAQAIPSQAGSPLEFQIFPLPIKSIFDSRLGHLKFQSLRQFRSSPYPSALNQGLFRCFHSFSKPFSLFPLQPQPTRAAQQFPPCLSTHSSTSTQKAGGNKKMTQLETFIPNLTRSQPT